MSYNNLQLSDEENNLLSHRSSNYNDTARHSQKNKDFTGKKYISSTMLRTNNKIDDNDLMLSEEKTKMSEYLASHREQENNNDSNEQDEEMQDEEDPEIEYIYHKQQPYPDME